MLDKRDLYKRRRYDAICKDFNLTSSHIHAFAHILFGIILREGYIKRVTKSKSLIIAGTPNSGKTSMVTALSRFFGTSIFYTVGARKDDFSGFNSSNSPLIVWDDMFGNKPNYRGRPTHN